MIKIIYPDGKTEHQDVRRLTNNDLFLIFGNWATMRYLYTTRNTAGQPVDFYIVYEQELQNADGSPHDWNKPFNEKVYAQYGIKLYGTAIVCKADVLDWEED